MAEHQNADTPSNSNFPKNLAEQSSDHPRSGIDPYKDQVAFAEESKEEAEALLEEVPEIALEVEYDLEDDRPTEALAQAPSGSEFALPHLHITAEDSIHEAAIYHEINWLAEVIWYRCTYPNSGKSVVELEQEKGYRTPAIKAPFIARAEAVEGTPKVPAKEQPYYYTWLRQYDLIDSTPDRLLLAFCLMTRLADPMLAPLMQLWRHQQIAAWVGGDYHRDGHRIIPTLRTVFFLLDGINPPATRRREHYFNPRHLFFSQGVVELTSPDSHETRSNQRLQMNDGFYHYFFEGLKPRPEDKQNLEIKLLESNLHFDELILPERTKAQLQPLINYAQHGQEFFKDQHLSKKFKRGYIALLYGPPGTGKTLIASTIGQHLGLVTYQLDVSQVVSKYIGETSQNINKVMDELTRNIEWLEGKPSILFIDEADSFMGKRLEAKDSKDHYANLDVSNLLQKFEQFPGLVILASNYEQNFDEAFKRRFKSEVHIPPPEADERTLLWKMYLPEGMQFPGSNFARVMAESFALTGAQIANVMGEAVIAAFADQTKVLDYDRHLEANLQKELEKSNRQYARPKSLMSRAQIDEAIYQQQVLWENALPTKWSYIPTFFPRLISQVVTLEETDIKDLVKKVKRRWEGGQFNHIPWKEGLEVVLRDFCVGKKLDWNKIQAHYDALEKAEKPPTPKEGSLEMDKKERAGKTVQLVDLDKLKKISQEQEEKEKENESKLEPKPEPVKASVPKILQGFAAQRAWKNALPKGHRFEQANTPNALSISYTLTEEQVQQVMTIVEGFLKGKKNKVIRLDVHIKIALEKYCQEQEIELESIYTKHKLAKIASKKASEERKKKQKLTKQEALVYWGDALPAGYQYAQRGTGSVVAQSYGPHSRGEIDQILANASKKAQEQDTTQISLAMIEASMQKLGLTRKRF